MLKLISLCFIAILLSACQKNNTPCSSNTRSTISPETQVNRHVDNVGRNVAGSVSATTNAARQVLK